MKQGIRWKNGLISRITLIYIILTAVPFIVSYFFTTTYWWNEIKDITIEHSKSSLHSSIKLIDMYLKQMDGLSMAIYYDDDLISILRNDFNLTKNEEKINLFRSFDKLFLNMSPSRPDVFNYYYFNLNGDLIYAYTGGIWLDSSPKVSHNNTTSWFKKTLEKDGRINILSTGLPYYDTDQPIFSISRLIKQSNEPKGVVLINFNFNIFNSTIKNSVSKKSDVIITDKQGNIIFNSGKILITESLPSPIKSQINQNSSGSVNVQYDGTRYLVVYDSIDDFSLKIIHLIPVSIITSKLNYIWNINLSIMSAMILLMCISIYYFYNHIKPLKQLTNAIDQSNKEPFNNYINVTTKDEIGIIGKTFNQLIDRLQKLIESDTKNKLEKLEIEKKMLEAQINPHFLYNTLDTIRFKALEQGNKDIANMLFTLSINLRYTILNNNQKVYVYEEIEWLERYIYLQKLRFEEKFKAIFNIDPQVNTLKIYRLILQPFIENTILHAFKNIESGGKLFINGFLNANNELVFEIIDNGCGFPEEIDQIINYELVSSINNERIGIFNTLHRLFLYYSKDCHVLIKSSPQKGTLIRILIKEM